METHPPALSDVVAAAGGLLVAQRGADPSSEADLRVLDAGPVALPSSAPSEAFAPNGALWRRLWMLPDRIVIEFVDRVAVEVRDPDGSVVFDRLLEPDVEQPLLLDHVLPLVLARRGNI